MPIQRTRNAVCASRGEGAKNFSYPLLPTQKNSICRNSLQQMLL